jgi:hypothetical protein
VGLGVQILHMCHGSGGQSPAFHGAGPGSCLFRSMQDLWLTKWDYDRMFSTYFYCNL